MNVKLFLAISSVILVLYGIAFLFIPKFVVAQFGIAPDAGVILTARFLGTTQLAFGLVVWSVREIPGGTALRGLLGGLAVGDAIAVLVAIWGTVRGITNAMGWSTAVIFVVLLVGCVYFLFGDRAVAGRT
jgi:hypothetical protein